MPLIYNLDNSQCVIASRDSPNNIFEVHNHLFNIYDHRYNYNCSGWTAGRQLSVACCSPGNILNNMLVTIIAKFHGKQIELVLLFQKIIDILLSTQIQYISSINDTKGIVHLLISLQNSFKSSSSYECTSFAYIIGWRPFYKSRAEAKT